LAKIKKLLELGPSPGLL